jgi:2-C-methyl-D-erythritol 2,4-cyclodiphosphate synthase
MRAPDSIIGKTVKCPACKSQFAVTGSPPTPEPEPATTRVVALGEGLRMRVGIGHDTHRLKEGRPLILGGVRIEHPRGLDGHSDADVVLHALTDALLGAAALGDLGDAFPDTDPAYRDCDSSLFVLESLRRLNQSGWRVVNVDAIIFAQEPKLGPVKQEIRRRLASLLGLEIDAVNVKAKTGEKVGTIGRGEAISCQVIALLDRLPKDQAI